MKVKDLIEQLKYYNQDADVFLNSNYKHIGFTLAFGGGDGVEKENCETVSIYPDDLGCESSQTEISDEEIEKGGWKYFYENKISLKNIVVWINACKWYREQLKQK
jgi:hypothetical protein